MGKKKGAPLIHSPINIAKHSISVPDFWMFDSPAGTVQMSFAYVQSVQHLDVSDLLCIHCRVNLQMCSRSSTSPICQTHRTFAVHLMWHYSLWDCPVKNREHKSEVPNHLVQYQLHGCPASPFRLGLYPFLKGNSSPFLKWQHPHEHNKKTSGIYQDLYMCVYIGI